MATSIRREEPLSAIKAVDDVAHDIRSRVSEPVLSALGWMMVLVAFMYMLRLVLQPWWLRRQRPYRHT